MMKLTNQQLFNKAMKEKAEREDRIYKAFRRKQLVFRGCINTVSYSLFLFIFFIMLMTCCFEKGRCCSKIG